MSIEYKNEPLTAEDTAIASAAFKRAGGRLIRMQLTDVSDGAHMSVMAQERIPKSIEARQQYLAFRCIEPQFRRFQPTAKELCDMLDALAQKAQDMIDGETSTGIVEMWIEDARHLVREFRDHR